MAGGPTAVLNASLSGIVKAAESHYDSVLGSRRGIEGFLNGELVDLGNFTSSQLAMLYNTPSASLETSRKRPTDDDIDQIVECCQRRNITGIVAIGGNDTADTVARIASRTVDLQIVEIPKTIDNDLPGTHYSLGYGSAAGFVASAVRDATIDTIGTASLYPVKFIESMGRNAGWLVAAGGLGCGSSIPSPLLCLPERPLVSFDALAALISNRLDEAGFAVIVVPETMRWITGQHVAGDEPEYTDQFGHQYFPSAGHALSRLVNERLGIRARYDKPGTLMRASTGPGFEQEAKHAYQCGVAAVKRLQAGESGVVLRLVPDVLTRSTLSVEIGTLPVAEVANVEWTMPDEMIAESGSDITPQFRSYALPIIGGMDDPYLLISWPDFNT